MTSKHYVLSAASIFVLHSCFFFFFLSTVCFINYARRHQVLQHWSPYGELKNYSPFLKGTREALWESTSSTHASHTSNGWPSHRFGAPWPESSVYRNSISSPHHSISMDLNRSKNGNLAFTPLKLLKALRYLWGLPPSNNLIRKHWCQRTSRSNLNYLIGKFLVPRWFKQGRFQ